MGFDWRSLVRSVAPTIGTALGGPLGGVAGLALAKALGVDEAKAGDAEALAAAVQGANPDQLLKLKQADQEFALQMQKLGYENLQALEKIAADDRSNARDREVKTRDWMPKVLAGTVVLGWLVVQGFLMRWEVPAGTREMVLRMLGTLDGAVMLVLGYYFGSSAGSDRKTEIIGGAK